MNDVSIDRRKLLKMGIAAGIVSLLPIGCINMSDDKLGRLLKPIGDSNLPINRKLTGKMTDAEFNALASLCEYVNKVWELTPDLGTYLKMLRADLELKTGEEPSYLTEYKNAVVLIDAVVDKGDDGDKGWATLLFSEFEEADFQSTQLGRARRFVFSEIITHFVPISGGFKTFGLWNYSGYFGGSYTSLKSYRKADIT